MYLRGRLISDAPQVLTTLLVFSLASGVLGGILFYMDSAGPSVLAEMTYDIPIHMEIDFTESYYNQSTVTPQDIINIVEEQEGIANVEHIKWIDGNYQGWLWRNPLTYYAYLGVSPTFFETFPDIVSLGESNLELEDGGCYLEKTFFEESGLHIGDQYDITCVTLARAWEGVQYVSRNFTVLGVFDAQGFLGTHNFIGTLLPVLRAFITTNDVEARFGSLDHAPQNGIKEVIWAKFDTSYLAQTLPSEAEENLQNIRKRIEQRTVPDAIVGSYAIVGVVNSYASWYSSMMTITIAFSIPSIVMGIVLVHYTSQLISDRQRRDIGMLRVRGASTRQALEWIMSIAFVTGTIGGIGAVLTGILASILSGSVRELLEFDLASSSSFVVLLQPVTILAVFGFSFGLGLIVSIPSAIKHILMPASEAHKEIERENNNHEEEMSSPIIDVIVMIVSGVLVSQIYLILGGGYISFSSWIISGLLIVSFGTFIIFTTRFLARVSIPFKIWLTNRNFKPTRTVGLRVIGRSTRLRSKSEALGIMFIAMVFTAGTFAAIASTTGTTHIQDLIEFQVGGDIVLDVNPAYANMTQDFVNLIEAVDGVQEASAMLSWLGLVNYRTLGPILDLDHNRTLSVFGIQPEAWFRTAFFESYFTRDLLPEEALSIMASNNQNIISSFKPTIGYDIAEDRSYSSVYGDTLKVLIYGQTVSEFNEMSIVDIMSDDEEIDSQTYLPGIPNENDFLLLNLNYLQQLLNIDRVDRFYIKLETGANYSRVMQEITNISPSTIVKIESPHSHIDQVLDTRISRSINGIYTLNILFSLFYLTIGMCIVAIERNRGYRKQFSVLRALGSQDTVVLSAFLIDTMLGIFVASLIGLFTGIILSLFVIQTPIAYIGTSTSLGWSRLPIAMVIPVDILSLVLALSFIIPLVAAFIVTKRSLQSNLAENLQSSL
ncbi:MAG: FtsX-like permease family protein [Candidatus Thorarchaeota archaeon]